jgi:hypothetical protein
VGPQDPIIKMIADDIQTPYLVTSRPKSFADDWKATIAEEFDFRLIPGDDIVATAVADLIKTLRWEDVAVLYSSQRGA